MLAAPYYMYKWVDVLYLGFVDNSDSPSVVEQSQQDISCGNISFIISLSLALRSIPVPYASCLVSCSVIWGCPCSSAHP